MLARCFALLDPRTRDLDFEKASQKPGYALMYPSDKPKRERNNQNKQWLRQKGNTVASQSSLKCIREAEANADAASGQVLNKVFEGKRLVDLADDITAVPSLSSDAISAYAFIKRYTGELVESTADRRRQVEEALATRAPFAENGGSIVDGANSGATAQAAMPSAVTSTPPAQDILEMLSVLVLPRSTQHGSVRDALRNNPSAVVFAAMSEEMAQRQTAAATAATLPSGETEGSGSGAWSGMTSGGLIVRSEDDLLGMLANLPASVLDGSVRDALRSDPSGLRLAAMAMWMLKERRQGQMQT